MRTFNVILIIALVILTSSCEKQYKLDLSKIIANNTSEGTIISANPATTVFRSGIALNNTHTITVQINVTKAGTYNISTDTINKIYFNASGSFNNTGMQTVVLQGHATPDTSGICDLTVKYGTANKIASIEIIDWWEFEAAGVKHTGKIDTAVFFDDGLFSYLNIQGSKPNTDTIFEILPFHPTGNTISSGKYGIMEPRNQVVFSFDALSNAGPAYYHSEPSDPAPPNDFTLQLTYNAATKISEGTFGGIATNDIGRLPTLIQITNGRFRVKVRP